MTKGNRKYGSNTDSRAADGKFGPGNPNKRENELMAKPKVKAKAKAKPKITAKEKKALERRKILNAVVDRLIEGDSLRQICRTKGIPDKSTILRWLVDDDELATIMARAREMQADALDDDIQDVVDEVRRGKLDPQAAQVIIRAHQWRAGKMKPRVYGEKQVVDVNHGVQDSDEIIARAKQAAERLGITLPLHLLGTSGKKDVEQ